MDNPQRSFKLFKDINTSKIKMNTIWKNTRNEIPKIGKLGNLSLTDKERILKYINELSNIDSFENIKEQCWIWTGTKQYNQKGHQHGSFWYNKKYVMIHRIMFHNFIENVPIYERKKNSIQVNHKCKSDGKCINPFHMYLGTPKQNTADCIKDGNKNKIASGEKNPNAKLSNELVEYIKNLKGKTNKSQKQLAIEFGVNQSQISRWWNGKTR